MTQKSTQKVTLLVDYENVQNFDLSKVQKGIRIKIFLGQSQSKIPIALVQAVQHFGRNVEWIRIEGSGSNSLDFHIAFYIGKLAQGSRKSSFVVLSKDKGFDPLIHHINQQRIPCRRIESLSQLEQTKNEPHTNQNEELVAKVMGHLTKIAKNKRPKNNNSLRQYLKSLLSKQATDHDIEQLIKFLFDRKKISEANSKITYNF